MEGPQRSPEGGCGVNQAPSAWFTPHPPYCVVREMRESAFPAQHNKLLTRRSRASSLNLTKHYRQRYQPAKRIIRTKLRLIDHHMNIRQPPDNSLERNLALQPGQGGPDTIVNTITEPQGAHRR